MEMNTEAIMEFLNESKAETVEIIMKKLSSQTNGMISTLKKF